MKKIICVILTIVLTVGVFAACKATPANQPNTDGNEKPVIVATIFPIYDWLRELTGDRADAYDLTMLMDSGVDLHNFQPSAADIMKIATCDMFVYVGGASDKWVEDVLKQAQNPDMITVNLLETLGDRAAEEEYKEGMEPEDEEEEEEGPAYDEHVWLSLKNAQVLCKALSEKLEALAPAQAEAMKANAAAYNEKLAALDGEFKAAADAASVKTLLFGDRFPFLYMVKDYGLDYFAAFMGCSAETEASFETVSRLAEKVDELGLKSVLQIETSDGSIARTIVENTKTGDQQILTMYSLQSITANDVNSGVTYLTEMQKNLEVLKQALQ